MRAAFAVRLDADDGVCRRVDRDRAAMDDGRAGDGCLRPEGRVVQYCPERIGKYGVRGVQFGDVFLHDVEDRGAGLHAIDNDISVREDAVYRD